MHSYLHRGVSTSTATKVVILALSFLAAQVSTAPAAIVPSDSAILGDDVVVSNCGVNATYFALHWFGLTTSIRNVADDLNAGEKFERDCSFKNIMDVCGRSKLDVAAFKADSVDDIVRFFKQGDIAIVRLSRIVGTTDIGHYIVMVPNPIGDIYLVDPPNQPLFMLNADISKSAILAAATGGFLVISKPLAASRSGPALSLQSDEIDLGRMPMGAGDVVASVNYRNIGTDVLRITNAKKSCDCIKSITGDMELQPGHSGTIQVVFDRTKLPAGANEKSLLLQTNDSLNSAVKLVIRFEIPTTPLPEEANAIPSGLNYGRATSRYIAGVTFTIEIRVPVKNSNILPVINAHASSPSLKLEEIKLNTTDEPQQWLGSTGQPTLIRIRQYEVRWNAPPRVGDISEKLTFDIVGDGVDKKSLEVPIRGEVYRIGKGSVRQGPQHLSSGISAGRTVVFSRGSQGKSAFWSFHILDRRTDP